jgi:hypothetical protein
VPVGGRKRARDITVDKVCHISLWYAAADGEM